MHWPSSGIRRRAGGTHLDTVSTAMDAGVTLAGTANTS